MRSTIRQPCALAIRVLHQGGLFSARLQDISRSGARIRGPDHLRPDAPLILLCGGIEIRGWTRWTRGTDIGVEFVQPIAPAQLTLLLTTGAEAAQSRP